MTIAIKASNILAQNIPPSGYSWTLASRLGEMLALTERKYGPRDYSYTILGIEFKHAGQPSFWYPGNRKHIVIQLTVEALSNNNKALYQLAHESIHLLSPVTSGNANYLEEGLATHFSEEYMATVINQPHWNSGTGPIAEKYNTARDLVRQLLAIDPNIILKIRKKQPTISLITAENILEENNNIPNDLIQQLIERF